MRELITGNQAIVRGALRAGCNFFAGYPITPASSILDGFVSAFADGSGVIVQTEDEIAAIGQCIGASMAGARAFTATSGPGLSLYSENIGLAQMIEAPLVIVDCQRMGPSTGGATASGEGDVLFARHVTSGGYPLPVLAATDVASAYRLTYSAFQIAERLRTPVIVLASKDLALTRQTADLDAVALPANIERQAAPEGDGFRPYAFREPQDIPDFVAIGDARRVRATGSIHDENGLLTIDRAKIARKLTHLRDKILAHADQLEDVEEDLDPEARVLVISYGVADGAARDAIQRLRRAGTRVSHLTLYSLWPIPQNALRAALTPGVQRVIVPELNIGLYVEVLRPCVGNARLESICRYDGGLIHPRTIVEHVNPAESPRASPISQEHSIPCRS